MTTERDAIEDILANAELDDEAADSSRCEEIERLVSEFGWDAVLNHLLRILRNDELPADSWRVAAEVIWGAALDNRSMPIDSVIAHLCLRWPHGPKEDNLAWSIISKLKNVDYLSDYDPLTDAAVHEELLRIRGGV